MKIKGKKKPSGPDTEKIKQNIFDAKTEKERKMWEVILNKIEGRKCK